MIDHRDVREWTTQAEALAHPYLQSDFGAQTKIAAEVLLVLREGKKKLNDGDEEGAHTLLLFASGMLHGLGATGEEMPWAWGTLKAEEVLCFPARQQIWTEHRHKH